MARIISVTFETTTQGLAGAFSVPKAAADVLGIGAGDSVELRVTWEGGRLELGTELRSGLEVHPRVSDPSAARFPQIPARTPVIVTVWRHDETAQRKEVRGRAGGVLWSDESFEAAFLKRGGSMELLRALREWALSRGISLRYGTGKTDGPLRFDVDFPGGEVTLFHLDTRGYLNWVFKGNLDRAPLLSAREPRIAFVRRISDLFGVHRADERADQHFAVMASSLSLQDHPRLLAALDDLLALVQQQPPSLRGQYRHLFTQVLERFKELRPGVTSTERVGTENWHSFSAGHAGFQFSWSTAYRKYFRAELYIDVGDQDKNKAYLEKLQSRGEELERAIGQPIAWERLDAKRGSRLAVYYAEPGEDFDSDAELIEWAAQTMARMVDVLRPIVAELK